MYYLGLLQHKCEYMGVSESITVKIVQLCFTSAQNTVTWVVFASITYLVHNTSLLSDIFN